MPRYDSIIYCDLSIGPAWVPSQVMFIERACRDCGIPFYILQSNLYRDYMENFGYRRVPTMPFWMLDEDGKEGRIRKRVRDLTPEDCDDAQTFEYCGRQVWNGF